MGGFFSNSRNVRIAIAAVFVIWVVCLAGLVVAGLMITRGSGAKGFLTATPNPVTETGIQLSPAEGYSGTQLTVTGRNWRPGEVIFIRLQNASGVTDENYAYAGAVANDAGEFNVSFSYPYDSRWLEGDAVQVVARAEASGVQATAPFRLMQPTQMPTPTQLVTPTPIEPTATPEEPTPAEPLPPGVPTPTRRPLPPPPPPPPVPVITDWMGVYFTNPDLAGQPAMIRNDQAVSFEWGMGGPAAGFPPDNFSAQWTRNLGFEGGNYRFHVRVDDGLRLFVDNQIIIDQWHDSGPATYVAEVYLNPGAHALRVDYYERVGWSMCQLGWERLQASYPDWKGEYYNNPDLAGGPVLVRNDPWIDFNWGTGSPGLGVPADNFSARWTRTLSFGDGNYRLYMKVDDGARLWVDDQLLIDQWHDSGPVTYVTDRHLSSGDHRVRLEYYDRTGGAQARLWWERVEASYPDWKGEYFSNRQVEGKPVRTRNDDNIDFKWGEDSPASGVPADNFSVRWRRKQNFDKTQVYRFYARVDDGVRIWVDGDVVVDEWESGPVRVVSGTRKLSGGDHDLQVEYYDHDGNAQIKVWWEKDQATTPTPSPKPTNTPVPTATQTPPPTATVPPSVSAIGLTPAQGPVGSPITVKGVHWPAGQTVSLAFAKAEKGTQSVKIDPALGVTSAVVGPDGAFQAGVVLPPGQGWESLSEALVVAYSADFQKTAVAPFAIVQPAEAATPTEVPPEQPTEIPPEQPTQIPPEQPTQIPPEQPTEQPTEIPPEQPAQVPTEPQPTATPKPPKPTREPKRTDTPVPVEKPVEKPTPQQMVISLTPISGTVGITLTVHGEGWPARAQVEFALGRPAVGAEPQVTIPVTGTVAQVSKKGQFAQPIWLPVGEGWENLPQVLIVAHSPDNKLEAIMPYTIVALPEPPPAPQEPAPPPQQ